MFVKLKYSTFFAYNLEKKNLNELKQNFNKPREALKSTIKPHIGAIIIPNPALIL